METNPVSIVVVLAGMAFVFLGLMQYIVGMMKSNDTTRIKLVDQLSELKQRNAELHIKNEELEQDVAKYKALVKKYYVLARRLNSQLQKIVDDKDQTAEK